MSSEARRATVLALLMAVFFGVLGGMYVIAVLTVDGQAIDDAVLAGREIETRALSDLDVSLDGERIAPSVPSRRNAR